MIKPLIKLRKWTWLPIKYKLQRKKYIKESTLRTKAEIWDKKKEIKKALIVSQRGLDQKEQYKYEVTLKVLNWITNDPTEGQKHR